MVNDAVKFKNKLLKYLQLMLFLLKELKKVLKNFNYYFHH